MFAGGVRATLIAACVWLVACAGPAVVPDDSMHEAPPPAVAATTTSTSTSITTASTDTSAATSGDAGAQLPDIEVVPRSAQWLIEQRDQWSENINTMAVGVDRFFAGETSRAENESYLRLRAGAVWSRGGELSSDSDIKLKVDLPGSKRRWKLLFDSNPDEFNDLESQNRVTPTTNEQFTDTEGSTGAVRFILDETSRWKRDFDVGVRGSTPLDPFARFQVRRSEPFADVWTFNFKESMYFFNQDGWGQKTTLVFERPLRKHYFWRNRIEAKYSDEDNLLESAFVISTVHVLDDWHAIDYAVGVIVVNQPVSQTSVYFINATFRKRLYEDWLFFDIRPEIALPRELAFRVSPSLTFGVDAYLWE